MPISPYDALQHNAVAAEVVMKMDTKDQKLEGGFRLNRALRRFVRHYAKLLGVWASIGLGLASMAFSVIIAPLPGPLGVPFMLFGLVMVLKNAPWARRHFIHLKRRYPTIMNPIRKMLRKNAPVASILWQQTLKVERFLTKGVGLKGFLAQVRRKFAKPRPAHA